MNNHTPSNTYWLYNYSCYSDYYLTGNPHKRINTFSNNFHVCDSNVLAKKNKTKPMKNDTCLGRVC